MSDRIEPIRRRTRGPAAVAGVAPLHDDDWRRRREDDAATPAAAPEERRPAPGGITLGDDGHVHVDLSA